MKRFIILAAALLCAVAANAQQLKTAQGITIETYEPKPEPEPKPKKTLAPTERGFEQSVEVNIGLDDDATYLIVGANYTAGYRFNNYIFAGGGAGLNFLNDNGSAIIPVYANVRGYFMRTRLKPFASLSIGTDIVMYNLDNIRKSEYWADLHLATNVGASYRLTDKLESQISLGYRCVCGGHHFITVNIGLTF